MPIEVEAPDGSVVEFPDGTPDNVMAEAMRKTYGSGPTENYDNNWTQYGKDVGRAFAQGITLNTSDEAIAGIRSLAGTDYDTAIKEEREALKRIREHHPIAGYGAELAGGLAMPGGAALSGMLRAPTLAGRIGRGASVGAGIGAAAGAGAAEGGIPERLAGAGSGALVGTGIGAGLPVAGQVLSPFGRSAYNFVSPTLARWAATREALADKYIRPRQLQAGEFGGQGGVGAESVGARPQRLTPADAAAEEVISNRGVQGGVTIDDIEQRLADYDRSRLMGSNSEAPSTISLMELDPVFAKTASSAGRTSDEAATRLSRFIGARQTGATPMGSTADDMAEMGLSTRNLFDPTKMDQVAGQHERVGEAFRRMLRIKDNVHHGHKKNARLTDEEVMELARKEADEFYSGPRGVYEAGKGYNLRPHIQPIFDETLAAARDAPPEVYKVLRNAQRGFTPKSGRSDIEAFDHAKRYMDDRIDQLFRSGDTTAGRALDTLRKKLIAAVDDIKHNQIGAKYNKARGHYASRMEARELIALGREAWGAELNVVRDLFKKIPPKEGDAKSKLVRLGLYQGYLDDVAKMKRGADVTGKFDTGRMQAIVAAAAPRSMTKGGRKKVSKGRPLPYADRPERFGDYVAAERAMVNTRNEVLGNSKTAQRLRDDDNFDAVSGLSEAFNSLRGGGTHLAIEAFKALANKAFGMRQDTAAKIAEKLATANRQEMEALLIRLRMRMGKNRFDQMSQIMQRYTAQMQGGGMAVGTAGASE